MAHEQDAGKRNIPGHRTVSEESPTLQGDAVAVEKGGQDFVLPTWRKGA